MEWTTPDQGGGKPSDPCGPYDEGQADWLENQQRPAEDGWLRRAGLLAAAAVLALIHLAGS